MANLLHWFAGKSTFCPFTITTGLYDHHYHPEHHQEPHNHHPQGCKIKMDDSGNILIKRIAKANVYVKSGDGENAVANEILKVRIAQNDTDMTMLEPLTDE